jgi:hypothetical protein
MRNKKKENDFFFEKKKYNILRENKIYFEWMLDCLTLFDQ